MLEKCDMTFRTIEKHDISWWPIEPKFRLKRRKNDISWCPQRDMESVLYHVGAESCFHRARAIGQSCTRPRTLIRLLCAHFAFAYTMLRRVSRAVLQRISSVPEFRHRVMKTIFCSRFHRRAHAQQSCSCFPVFIRTSILSGSAACLRHLRGPSVTFNE